MRILARHSFESNSMATSREASKCLANVLLLEGSTRQMFVDLGYPVRAAQRLKVGHLATYLSCEPTDLGSDRMTIEKMSCLTLESSF